MQKNYLIKVTSQRQFEKLLEWCEFRRIDIAFPMMKIKIETNYLFRFCTGEKTMYHASNEYYEKQDYYNHDLIGFENFILEMNEESVSEQIIEDDFCNIEVILRGGNVASIVQIIDFFHCKKLNNFLEPYTKENCCGSGYTLWSTREKATQYFENFILSLKREISNIKFQDSVNKIKTISVCL